MKNTTRARRLRSPLALLAVAGFLGVVVVAPFSVNSGAEAAPLPDMERLNQTFVPNEQPEMDLVYVSVEAELSEEEKARIEAEKKAEEEAEAKAKAEAEAAASAETAAAAAPPRYTGGGSRAEWMKAAGIAEKDWGYVDFIVSKESGWNPNAVNASSGASGLVQALPCSKVPGSCFDPVDNLRWADGYAKGRYGSWAKAYDFWLANHWW